MTCQASPVLMMRPGESRYILTDWGDNEPQGKTGKLAANETVESCTISVKAKPAGADNPTLGSVTIPANSLNDDIRGRVWDEGEATKVLVTMASDQDTGTYELEMMATTNQSQVLSGIIKICVV